MGFCCGASMLGTMGTLKYGHSYIHEVPIVYCPICQKTEVHHSVKEEYEILADYAHTDQAPEVYFTDYVDLKDKEELFADCIDIAGQSVADVIRSQIDNALDLLSISKKMKDEEWEAELRHRLNVLSDRLRRYQRKRRMA